LYIYLTELNFRNKEESNQVQVDSFLRLSPSKRFEAFLHLCQNMAELYGPPLQEDKGNFILTSKNHKHEMG